MQTILDPRAAPISGDPGSLAADRLESGLECREVHAEARRRAGAARTRQFARRRSWSADTGIGIAPDFLPHIFERFRQADSGTTREHGGLGLGLAIVRHLVELHGGTIHAASGGRDQGSTFRVRLPLDERPPAKRRSERRIQPTTDARAHGSRSCRTSAGLSGADRRRRRRRASARLRDARDAWRARRRRRFSGGSAGDRSGAIEPT